MSTMTTSSMTDTSMQLLTVTLDMGRFLDHDVIKLIFSFTIPFLFILIDAYNFLGISIVGHANDDGVGGIYVGTVMKGLVTLLYVM